MIHITATARDGSLVMNCIKQAISIIGVVALSPDKHFSSEQLTCHLTDPDFYDIKLRGSIDKSRASSEMLSEIDMTFEFNFGVMVTVKADSNPEELSYDLALAILGKIGKTIGPYPSYMVTDRGQEYDATINTKRERVEARMANAPAMEFSDRPTWDAALLEVSGSIYGTSITSYAERWARLMQLEMSEGKDLADIWNETSLEADFKEVTWFSLGVAVHLLSRVWMHGPELLELHKAYWHSDSSESTVNPTTLTIDASEN